MWKLCRKQENLRERERERERALWEYDFVRMSVCACARMRGRGRCGKRERKEISPSQNFVTLLLKNFPIN